jgi:ABC-type polysaccharide/polyol phosphate transport system ATPase subunit
MAGLGIGFNVNLSGRENVYLYGSILGNSNEAMNGLMESIIDFSDLNGFIDQPLRTYSAGMRARLGFSIASAVKPDILLIDEVLSVGDQEFREKSMARILEIVKGSRTVIIVSHNFNIMKQICTRLIMIEKGEIMANGKPEEVIDIYFNKA